MIFQKVSLVSAVECHIDIFQRFLTSNYKKWWSKDNWSNFWNNFNLNRANVKVNGVSEGDFRGGHLKSV